MEDNNKRITKNTLMLYVRMLFLMAVSFYTSRIVLNALGVEDYGVYNVVGGLVGFLSFINSSFSLATNRFLSYALGRKDEKLLNNTFNMSVELHFAISIIIIILGETVGIWYFNNYINLAETSYKSAMVVYQCSVASCVIGINSVPFIALAISHERMNIYAYLSIIEGLLKLGVAFLLLTATSNRLELYAILHLVSVLLVFIVWFVHAKRKYAGIQFKLFWDKKLFGEIRNFISWQFIGAFSWLMRNQGVTLVLNYFFGPVLNTARTISVQVNAGITSLMTNFQTAVNPQLVKDFAGGHKDEMHLLLFRSSKFSFMLVFIIALPVLVTTEPLLKLWLKIVPEYSVIFVRLMIIATLVDAMSGTLTQTTVATGRIKLFTIVTTTIRLSEILIVYILFRMGFQPQTLMYVEILMFFGEFIGKLMVLHRITDLSILSFLKSVTIYEIGVCVIAFVILYILNNVISIEVDPIMSFFISMFLGIVVVWMIGVNKNEKGWVIQELKNIIKRN